MDIIQIRKFRSFTEALCKGEKAEDLELTTLYAKCMESVVTCVKAVGKNTLDEDRRTMTMRFRSFSLALQKVRPEVWRLQPIALREIGNLTESEMLKDRHAGEMYPLAIAFIHEQLERSFKPLFIHFEGSKDKELKGAFAAAMEAIIAGTADTAAVACRQFILLMRKHPTEIRRLIPEPLRLLGDHAAGPVAISKHSQTIEPIARVYLARQQPAPKSGVRAILGTTSQSSEMAAVS